MLLVRRRDNPRLSGNFLLGREGESADSVLELQVPGTRNEYPALDTATGASDRPLHPWLVAPLSGHDYLTLVYDDGLAPAVLDADLPIARVAEAPPLSCAASVCSDTDAPTAIVLQPGHPMACDAHLLPEDGGWEREYRAVRRRGHRNLQECFLNVGLDACHLACIGEVHFLGF